LVKGAPFRLHCTPCGGLFKWKLNRANGAVVTGGGYESSVMVSGPAITVNDRVAGVGSTRPCTSIARTSAM